MYEEQESKTLVCNISMAGLRRIRGRICSFKTFVSTYKDTRHRVPKEHTERASFTLLTYTFVDVSCFFLVSGSGEDEECLLLLLLLLCTSFTSGLLSVLTGGEIDL